MSKLSNRIGYIDEMRGLAMCLVVIGHVFLFSFNIEAQGFISSFLCGTLQLPLFFMISGFCVIKQRGGESSNELIIIKSLLKFIKLVIPTLLFMSIYCLLNQASIISSILNSSKSGYWYPISLAEFILFFSILQIIINKYNKYANIIILSCILLSIIIIPIIDVYVYSHFNAMYRLVGCIHFKHFIFFLFGAWLHMNIAKVSKLIRNGKIIAYLIAFFLLYQIWQINSDNNLLRYLISYPYCFTCLFLVLTFYFKETNKNNVIGRGLRYIGKHTLEIYFLHYFFVQMDLHFMGVFFQSHLCPLLEFVTAALIAFFVIYASLVVGKILRLNPWISSYLLGVKTPRERIDSCTNM